jgi:hypothetical protein
MKLSLWPCIMSVSLVCLVLINIHINKT